MADSKIDDGGPAFPVSLPGWGDNGASGITMRDWFATHAPEPTKEAVQMQANLDRARNPHNEFGYGKPPRREYDEIVCDLKYDYADKMIRARSKPRST